MSSWSRLSKWKERCGCNLWSITRYIFCLFPLKRRKGRTEKFEVCRPLGQYIFDDFFSKIYSLAQTLELWSYPFVHPFKNSWLTCDDSYEVTYPTSVAYHPIHASYRFKEFESQRKKNDREIFQLVNFIRLLNSWVRYQMSWTMVKESSKQHKTAAQPL